MRFKVGEDTDGIDPRKCEVFLNGTKLINCVEADEEQGYVEIITLGNQVSDGYGGSYRPQLHSRLEGEVRIKYYGAIHQRPQSRNPFSLPER